MRNYKSDTIYCTSKPTVVNIKSYKLKRLAFVNDQAFWTYWRNPGEQPLTFVQLVYKLTTALSLARFTEQEIVQMLIGWHNKHQYVIDYEGLRFIMRQVDEFTAATRRERKREEMRRYRARKKTKSVSEVSNGR